MDCLKIIKSKSSFFILIFLLLLSFSTRFYNLGFPPRVVFDEAHFGLYATKYLSHQYYLDIHPPLGKMLLGLAAYLGNLKPGFDFVENSPYGDFNFLVLRFLPALFGSLFVVLIYLLVIELGFSKRMAFLAGFFVLFDNALIIQSRLILLDIILVFFIFLSIYLFLLTKRFPVFSKKWYFLNFLLALSLGSAISVKWTGFGVLGIIWIFSIIEDKIFSLPKKEILTKTFFFLIFPLLIYFLIFAVHFYLLPSACLKNCGAVLEKEYAKENDFFNKPPSGNLFLKFIQGDKLMLIGDISRSTPAHYYQSDWYGWPFMVRPIQYFIEEKNNKTSFLYFFGNPIIWWLGIVGVLGFFYLIIKNYFLKFKLNLLAGFYSPKCLILVAGYLIYLLPFAAIKRFMLIYHYLPALTFSIIFFALFFEGILKMVFGSSKKADFLFFSVLLLVFFSFLYFSPLTYGIPLTNNEFQSRMWLSTWSF